MLKMRDAVHLDFDGNCDLLLDLLRGPARPLRNDLHPSVGDIGIGFDRQVVERDHAPNKEKNRHAQDNEAAIQGEINDGANHYCCCSAEFWNSSALPTTCWLSARPETISCRPPGSISPPTTSVRRNLPLVTGT